MYKQKCNIFAELQYLSGEARHALSRLTLGRDGHLSQELTISCNSITISRPCEDTLFSEDLIRLLDDNRNTNEPRVRASRLLCLRFNFTVPKYKTTRQTCWKYILIHKIFNNKHHQFYGFKICFQF